MKTKVTSINLCIALQLNVAIAFEALILNRLVRLPKSRREDWLRGLLVQGFQHECRALKKLQHTGPSSRNPARHQNISKHPSVSAATHQSSLPQPKTNLETNPAAIEAQHSGGTVSFAALRKVIG